jgi:hypothetical protein
MGDGLQLFVPLMVAKWQPYWSISFWIFVLVAASCAIFRPGSWLKGWEEAIRMFFRRRLGKRYDVPETNRIFEQEINLLTGKTNSMNSIEQLKLDEARAKAKKEVKKENNILFVTNLLTQTSFPVPRIALLVGVSEAYVKKVKELLKK